MPNLQPREREAQFGLGEVLQHSGTATPLIEDEEADDEDENDFEAPGEGRAIAWQERYRKALRQEVDFY
jgi:hypothetical protein